jgi:HEAT repeat protein
MHTTRPFFNYVVLFAALIVMLGATPATADGPSTSPEKEKELLAVLRSDSPASEKAITCKNLAIYGSSAAVPDLARLLPDPQLSSWARIALEAIPGKVADEALRKATDSLEGRLLIGTINSIGFRQDANAVDLLTARLQDKNADVASAAAVALGHIGNAPAAKALRQSLAISSPKVRSAVAEGCVLCAERLVAQGQANEAVEFYDAVRKADVPKQRIIEATRGAILARNEQGIPLLLEQFRSPDKRFFQLALTTAREFPGGEFDKALAGEVATAVPYRAALIIQAMADREETVVLTAVLRAAERGPKVVRMAAIDALGRVGDASCLSVLMQISMESDEDLAGTARATLADLSGDKIDSQIVALLATAKGKTYPFLIELVGQRRIDAVPELLKALDHSDSAVRSAALTALGETVTLKRFSVLVSLVVAPKYAADAPVAQKALRAASVRMPDREACAAQLAVAIPRSPSATKSILLEILSDVGGTKALNTLGAAAKSTVPVLQDTASRLLGKWNSVDAAPILLDLSKSASIDKYRVRALRGYIGLARKFAMPEVQRAAMCQKALNAARQPAQQKLVLEVLKLHPSAPGLKLAIDAIQIPTLKNDATQAALVIAQKIGVNAEDTRRLLTGVGLAKVKLEIIKAEYGNGSSQRDVTAAIRKQAGSLRLITLASDDYNTSFGGDPLPGVVKRLRIQYRINGKAGEATFAENALIILPIPK